MLFDICWFGSVQRQHDGYVLGASFLPNPLLAHVFGKLPREHVVLSHNGLPKIEADTAARSKHIKPEVCCLLRVAKRGCSVLAVFPLCLRCAEEG